MFLLFFYNKGLCGVKITKFSDLHYINVHVSKRIVNFSNQFVKRQCNESVTRIGKVYLEAIVKES